VSGALGFSTLGCSGAPLEEVLATARRHGAPGVELRAAADEPVHTGTGAEELAVVRRRFDDAGVAVLTVCSYVHLCAPDPDEEPSGAPDAQVEDVLAHARLATALGARGVRVFMRDADLRDHVEGDEPTAGEERALRRLAEVAERLGPGVRVLVETHDSHSSAQRMARFLTLLEARTPHHPCGVVWDSAHTWVHGEAPAQSLDLLWPWLDYVQVKDVRSPQDPLPVAPGAGSYPIHQLARALHDRGWEGPVSLEWERKWHPELPTIDEALAAARPWAAPLFGGTTP